MFCFKLDGKSYGLLDSKFECTISWTSNHGCYGDCLSLISATSRCRCDISLTSWSVEEFLFSLCQFGQPKDNKFAPMVPAILWAWDLDVQLGLFKLTMKSNIVQAMAKVMALASNKVNPTIINPFTRMRQVIHAWHLLFNASPKYLKVVEIAKVHVFGFVERCINFVTFSKNKVWNRLNNHLELVVSMYAQKFFTLNNFPYEDTYEMWSNVQSRNGWGRYA